MARQPANNGKPVTTAAGLFRQKLIITILVNVAHPLLKVIKI